MGDLFGAQQSGDKTFRYADPIRDEALNLLAMESAEELLRGDPTLEKREHAAVRTALAERYPRALALFRVG
jgi:RecG-like helicase